MELIKLTAVTRNGRAFSEPIGIEIKDIVRPIESNGTNALVIVKETRSESRSAETFDQVTYEVTESLTTIASKNEKLIELTPNTRNGRTFSPTGGTAVFLADLIRGAIRVEGADDTKFNFVEEGDLLLVEYIIDEDIDTLIAASFPIDQIKVNQTVYVDTQYGIDATGVRENMGLAFKTGIAALAAALPGDTVWFRRGNYDERILGKDLVDIHLEQGARLRESTVAVLGGLIDDTVATGTGGTLRMRITGEGEFVRSGEAAEFFIDLEDPASEIYIEGKGFNGINFSKVVDGKVTARFENDIDSATAAGKIMENSGGDVSIRADRILGGAALMGTVSGGDTEITARKINSAGGAGIEMIEVTGGKLSINNSRIEQDGVAVGDDAFRMAAGNLVLDDVTIVLGDPVANEDVAAAVAVSVHIYGDTRSNVQAKNVNVTERVSTTNRDSNVI